MRTIEELRRSGVSVEPAQTIQSCAAIMEQAGVGALAVVREGRLVGIVTDRDLVRRGLAQGLPPYATVNGVMTSPVVTVDANADLDAAFGLFRSHAVRRLAVLRDGYFIGMISVDDLIVDIASDLRDLSWPIRSEVLMPQHDGPAPS